MSPKFVDKELKIREIAMAAIALFSKKGFAATSVEEIAEAAGMGKGTIYEYFKTKEGVFVAAIEEWIGEAETQILEILHGIDDPVERLHAFVNRNIILYLATLADGHIRSDHYVLAKVAAFIDPRT